MKILITGACGFIGSNLCSHLLNQSHEIIAVDNLSNHSINPTDRIKKKSGENWKNFKFYKDDIRDYSTLTSVFANEKPDCVINLAALGSIPRSFKNPSEMMSTNVVGFTNIMMLASISNCERVVFASSSSVYGDDDSKFRTEDKIGKPLNPYAISKLQNEQFADVWCKNISMKYVGLRFFNVYGDGQLIDSPYSTVIPRFINNKEITIYGDGETTRDFTHVDDVCEAIELSLTTSFTNEIYNVGTGHKTSLNKLAELCARGKKEIKRIAERPADVKESVACISKANNKLKYLSRININEGIEKTIKYYEIL